MSEEFLLRLLQVALPSIAAVVAAVFAHRTKADVQQLKIEIDGRMDAYIEAVKSAARVGGLADGAAAERQIWKDKE